MSKIARKSVLLIYKCLVAFCPVTSSIYGPSSIPLSIGHRMLGALTPDNRMKRWTYCGFGLWLLSDWIEILGIFAGIMLFISLVYYSWKTSVYLKDK